MTKSSEPPFPPVTKRRSATQEDLAVRRTDEYPPASPHRVGHTPGLHPEDAPYQSQEIKRPGLRTTRANGYTNDTATRRSKPIGEDDEEESHAYAESPKRGRTTQRVYPLAQPTRRLEKTRFHPLVFVGIGLFIMIAGWLSFSALSSWWSVQLDDWHYGRPRTFQTDQVVGHNDSAQHPSHFLAMNLNGKILVMELPGGDPSQAKVYIAPTLFGAGSDLTPVWLTFEDCNGDGKPDLNIHIQGSDKIICFVNNGKTFTPTSGQ